jgi:MFS family permease
LVLVVATLAWSFDCLNQQIFNLTRMPAMADLLHTGTSDLRVSVFGPWSTAALLIGWATGGIVFGILGDRIGRAKTLLIMILSYSLSTGLCGLSVGPWDYLLYSFITGFGAGGIFPVGCTLLAESVPDKARPHALGMMQTFSALGNVAAGVISLGMVVLLATGVISSHWRWMFSVGIIPALLSIIVVRKIREPEVWVRAVAERRNLKKGGSLTELFSDPRWRSRAIVGLMLAVSGVVGLWGIGVFSNDLTQRFIGRKLDDAARKNGEARQDLQFVAQVIASPAQLDVAKKIEARDLLSTGDEKDDAKVLYGAALRLAAAGQTVSPESVLREVGSQAQNPEDATRRSNVLKASAVSTPVTEHVARISKRKEARRLKTLRWAAYTLIMFNVGAFFGMYAFARVTNHLGRRPTFAIFFTAAMLSTAFAFLFMSETTVFWLVPLMGAAQLSVFGGYAIYFPELFPTRLRSTGASFCYNVGRYVAAAGPLGISMLNKQVFAPYGEVNALRYSGVVMCSCYLVGLVALLFAPETKGQPLPE